MSTPALSFEPSLCVDVVIAIVRYVFTSSDSRLDERAAIELYDHFGVKSSTDIATAIALFRETCAEGGVANISAAIARTGQALGISVTD
jgi:hypothetical protein